MIRCILVQMNLRRVTEYIQRKCGKFSSDSPRQLAESSFTFQRYPLDAYDLFIDLILFGRLFRSFLSGLNSSNAGRGECLNELPFVGKLPRL